MTRQKVVAIVGPTASGKSDWAVTLAKQFDGIVISADSRQVYQGLNVATAKITKPEMQGVPHFMLDIVKPTEDFDVATYQNLVYGLLKKVGHKKLPIVAGGTGLYIQAVTDGYVFSTAKPDKKLRERLSKQSLTKSVQQLKKLSPELQIDFKNPRRVIRALEIALSHGPNPTKRDPGFDTLKIGIEISPEEQARRIEARIRKMNFEQLAKETKKLIKLKFDFSSNPLTALYYRFVRDWIEKKITKDELIEKLIRGDKQYAKRQMTWFKKDQQIRWVKTKSEAKKMINQFLADAAR